MEGRKIGSLLIGQEFKSPKFFHIRDASDTTSGVDPHITPEYAFAQIMNVSETSEIPSNVFRTIIELNIVLSRNPSMFLKSMTVKLGGNCKRTAPSLFEFLRGDSRIIELHISIPIVLLLLDN
jgi:K+-transporting ATPase c subunit